MLDRFWQQYPNGSIIGRLLHSDRGQYVACVTISIDGVPRVSAMAEGETVVAAEDLARNRALSLLPLDDGAIEDDDRLSSPPAIDAPVLPPTKPQITPPASKSGDRSKIERSGKDSDDFAKIAFGINTEMNRLGWSKAQGRECLVELYDKTSCALLTDDELIGFLQHLEGLS